MRHFSFPLYSVAALLLFANDSSTAKSTAAHSTKDQHLKSSDFFKQPPLKIAFSAGFGGESHAAPQLVLADILVARGHDASFITYDDVATAWAADYPRVKPVKLGPNPQSPESFRKLQDLILKENPAPLTATSTLLNKLNIQYPKDYKFFHHWISTNKVDVMVCDFFMSGCYDAAYETNTPFVITTSAIDLQGYGSMSYTSNYLSRLSSSTHDKTSFFERFYDKIIMPTAMAWKFKELIQEKRATYSELNVTPYMTISERWRHGLVLVNNLLALEPARQLPSTTFLIGPAIPHKYASLSSELSEFMDARKNVVYVGFGGNTILSRSQISTIISSLLVAYDDELIDGVVWGLMRTADNHDLIPETVTVNGVVHSIRDMQSGKHAAVRLLNRAPQRAVLEHPSTRLFISHCGIASLFESLFAGVPILGLPGFGDQPSNAIKLTEKGYGLWLDKTTLTEATIVSTLRRLLAKDSAEAASFKANVFLAQRMIQIADRERMRGADLIELAAIPGAIKAYESADWRMPWWTANNYDLYAFLLFIVLSVVYLSLRVVKGAISVVMSKQSKQKQA
ncbi:hypothetical protein BDF19DRAFT_437438 [Syncephalis fuscata]|nr:hypothetical protein BDF19DRAFT_437438 [Syncephalis fuscata]